MPRTRSNIIALAFGSALALPAAHAVPFDLIRIGDVDGFGYGNAGCIERKDGTSCATGDDGGPPDDDGDGILDNGDFLPDLTGDSVVSTGSRDNFDLRSVELGGTYTEGSGFTQRGGTTGSQFTDISLSTSYDTDAAAGTVLSSVGDPDVPGDDLYATGGPFPAPPAAIRPNQPGFRFDFTVEKADVDPASDLFFNVVFADYDVFPADLEILNNLTGALTMIGLTRQDNAAGEDGLVQAAFATLSFFDVFAELDADTWEADLSVDFDAPNEPYTAFDYVELSLVPIDIGVPEPGSLGLLALALGAIGAASARRR